MSMSFMVSHALLYTVTAMTESFANEVHNMSRFA